MKLFLVTILLAASCGCLAGTTPEINLDAGTKNTLARIASVALFQGFEEVQSRYSESGFQTKGPALPIPDDPLNLPNINFTIPEVGDIIKGNVVYENVVLTGGSTLLDDLVLPDLGGEITLPITVSYELGFGDLSLTGDHDTTISAVAGLVKLTGQGPFELQLVDFFFRLSLKVNVVTEIISIEQFSIDLGFQNLTFNFADTELTAPLFNGPVDWALANAGVNCLFPGFWTIAKREIENLVLTEVNNVLAECVIADLTDLNFTCLGFPPAPETKYPGLQECKLTQLIDGDYSCVNLKEIGEVVLPNLYETVKQMNAGIQEYDCSLFIPTTTETPNQNTTPSAASFAQLSGLLFVLPIAYLFA